MAMGPERWDHLAIPHDRRRGQAKTKPAKHEDFYLCVVFVVLLAWALYVGLGAVNW